MVQLRTFIFNYPISLYLISKFFIWLASSQYVVSAVYDPYTAHEGSYSKVQCPNTAPTPRHGSVQMFCGGRRWYLFPHHAYTLHWLCEVCSLVMLQFVQTLTNLSTIATVMTTNNKGLTTFNKINDGPLKHRCEHHWPHRATSTSLANDKWLIELHMTVSHSTYLVNKWLTISTHFDHFNHIRPLFHHWLKRAC